MLIYNIKWYMFNACSTTSEMEYLYHSHIFHFKEIHTSFRMVLIFYWYTMAIHIWTSYMESVCYLDESQSVTFSDSVSIFYFKVLSGKLSEI